jgi:hypothetical protein
MTRVLADTAYRNAECFLEFECCPVKRRKLPCASLDTSIEQTPLCIFIGVYEPAVLDGSISFS